MPSVTGLVTTASLNTKPKEIENKIPETRGFITTPEFKRLTKINFKAETKQEIKGLIGKVKQTLLLI